MKTLLAAGTLAALLAAAPALADEPPTPTLQANGYGMVMAVPDIAIVTIGVTTRGEAASSALAANSTDVAKVLDAIKGEGVVDKDIATSGFSIYPVYEQPKDGEPQTQPPKIVGYQVSNDVRVTIRDIATSGGILDKVVSAGANQVNGISFDVADRKTPAEAALKDAIADAKAKAEIMAEAAGVKLVRVLSVSSSVGGGPRPVFMRAEMADKAVPVMPGEQTISVTASVSWEIAPQ
jgi:uncharacterized protein YggE